MFTLVVHTGNLELINYLQIEATSNDSKRFTFSSVDRAVSVLSQYLYHFMKREALNKLIPKSNTSKNEIESFQLFIPYEYEEDWKKRVAEKLNNYINLENLEEFYVDGFITFRLQRIKERYLDYLREEYMHFKEINEPSSSIESLIDFMDSQHSEVEEVCIVTKENGEIELRENNQCLYVETNNLQENIIVQSIFVSPKTVRVIDNHDILRKESIIVLRQIFGGNLVFEK